MSFNKSQLVEIVSFDELPNPNIQATAPIRQVNGTLQLGQDYRTWTLLFEQFLSRFRKQLNFERYFKNFLSDFRAIIPTRRRTNLNQINIDNMRGVYERYFNFIQINELQGNLTTDIKNVIPDYTNVPTDTGNILKEWNTYVTGAFTNKLEINKSAVPSQFNLPIGYIQKLDAYNSFVQQKQQNPLMNFNMNISDLLLTESNPTPSTIKKDEKEAGFIKQNDNVYFKPQTSSDADLGQYIIEPLESNISLSRDERNNYIVSYQGKRKVFKPMEKNQAKVFIFMGAFEADRVQEYRKNRLIDFGFKKRIPGRTFVTY